MRIIRDSADGFTINVIFARTGGQQSELNAMNQQFIPTQINTQGTKLLLLLLLLERGYFMIQNVRPYVRIGENVNFSALLKERGLIFFCEDFFDQGALSGGRTTLNI